jgi:DNA adenine methylase
MPANPIFCWAGSKRKLLPKLLANVPEAYGTYIEPFAGSACLFFALEPADAVLGDFNQHLIEAYIGGEPMRLSIMMNTGSCC